MQERLREHLFRKAESWYKKWENTSIPAFKGDICGKLEGREKVGKNLGLTKSIEVKFYYTNDRKDLEAAKSEWEFVKLKIGDQWDSFTEAWDKWCNKNCFNVTLLTSTFIPNSEISKYSYYDMAWNPTKLYSQGKIENEFIPFLSLPSNISDFVYIPLFSLYVVLI